MRLRRQPVLVGTCPGRRDRHRLGAQLHRQEHPDRLPQAARLPRALRLLQQGHRRGQSQSQQSRRQAHLLRPQRMPANPHMGQNLPRHCQHQVAGRQAASRQRIRKRHQSKHCNRLISHCRKDRHHLLRQLRRPVLLQSRLRLPSVALHRPRLTMLHRPRRRLCMRRPLRPPPRLLDPPLRQPRRSGLRRCQHRAQRSVPHRRRRWLDPRHLHRLRLPTQRRRRAPSKRSSRANGRSGTWSSREAPTLRSARAASMSEVNRIDAARARRIAGSLRGDRHSAACTDSRLTRRSPSRSLGVMACARASNA